MNLTDKELLLIARTDPQKAFRLSFDQYWESLYRQARTKVDSAEAAKDLVQDVFVVLWDQIHRLSEQERLGPYLFGVLRNKIFKLYEKDQVRLRYAVQHTQDELVRSNQKNPLDDVVAKELDSIIAAEIEALPDRMRLVYTMRNEEGLSIKEIAEHLNLSQQTVKNQLHSATQRLRKRINEYGWAFIFGGTLQALESFI